MTIEHGNIPFEAYKGDEPYIFVSYSHRDSGFVFNEIKRLHEAGYRIWYDEGISPTHEWSEEIAVALERSAIFAYFVSERSVDSKNCRDEAFFALDIGKPFLAIYIEETDVPRGLKLRTNRIQAVMKHQLPASIYEKRLEKALEPFNVKEASLPAERLADITAAPEPRPAFPARQLSNYLTPKLVGISVAGLCTVLLVIWVTFLLLNTAGSSSLPANTKASSNDTPASNNTSANNIPTSNNTLTSNNTSANETPAANNTSTTSNKPASDNTPDLTPANDPVPHLNGILGADDAIKVSQLASSPLKAASSAVGLIVLSRDGQKFFCTGFLIGKDLALTASSCVEGMDSAELKMGDEGEQIIYKVEVPPVEIVSSPDGLNFALLRVFGNPGLSHADLRLATSGPVVGQSLSIVMFRGGNEKLAVTGAADCRVVNLEDSVFNHRCDTGAGTTGSPILSADGSKVLGIHFKRDAQGGLAVRADKILSRSKVFQSSK